MPHHNKKAHEALNKWLAAREESFKYLQATQQDVDIFAQRFISQYFEEAFVEVLDFVKLVAETSLYWSGADEERIPGLKRARMEAFDILHKFTDLQEEKNG